MIEQALGYLFIAIAAVIIMLVILDKYVRAKRDLDLLTKHNEVQQATIKQLRFEAKVERLANNLSMLEDRE